MHKKLLHLCIFVELWCIFLGLGDRPLHPRLLQVLLRLLDVGCNLVLFPLQNTHQLTILSKLFPLMSDREHSNIHKNVNNYSNNQRDD